MRPRMKRLIAALLTASMLAAQAPAVFLGEQATEGQAPATEAQTQAPATEAQTQAPATEAQTQAPATEAQIQAPATEAQTQAPATEGQTQPTENASEQPKTEQATETESESETDKKKEKKEKETNTFTAAVEDAQVTVKLSGKNTLPESTKLVLRRLTGESDPQVFAQAKDCLEDLLAQGHRELSLILLYDISFQDKEGKTVTPSGEFTVTFTYPEGRELGLDRYLEPAAAVYVIDNGQAQELSDAALNEGALVTAFEVTLSGPKTLILAGVQNHVNDGEEVTSSSLAGKLSALSAYAVVSDQWDEGKEDQDALTGAGKGGEDKEDAARQVSSLLKDGAAFSLTLANGKSTKDTAVVNLYAREDGTVDTAPLAAVLNEEKTAINVTGRTVVINIFARSADQTITLPAFPAVSGTAGNAGEAQKENAGRILYNIIAQGDKKEPYDFTGTVKVEGAASGTILAAMARVKLSGSVTGAVYAAALEGAAERITKAQLGYGQEAETEQSSEGETQSGENGTQASAETETESETVAVPAGDALAGGALLWTEEAEDAGTRRGDGETAVAVSFAMGAVTSVASDPASQTYLKGAAFKLEYLDADGNWQPVKDGNGDAVILTSSGTGADQVTVDLTEGGSNDGLRSVLMQAQDHTAQVQVTETAAPAGCALKDPADGKKTVTLTATVSEPETTDDGEVKPGQLTAVTAAPSEALFFLHGVERFTLSTSVRDTDGAYLPGAKITVTAAKSPETAGEGTYAIPEVTTAADASSPVVVNVEDEAFKTWAGDAGQVTLTFTQTASPEGYLPKPDETQANQTKTVTLTKTGADWTASQEAVDFTDVKSTFDLEISSLLQDGATPVTGAAYVVRDGADQTVQKDGADQVILSADAVTDGKPVPTTQRISLTAEQLSALGASGETGQLWKAVYQSSPGFTLASSAEVSFTLGIDAKGNVAVKNADSAQTSARAAFTYRRTASITTDIVRVSKYNYYNGSAVYFSDKDRTYYVALFDGAGNRRSEVKAITIPKGKTTSYADFTGLEPGTYYVHEVTSATGGTIVDEDISGVAEFYASYASSDANPGSQNNGVTITGTAGNALHTVTVSNHYKTAPQKAAYYASFRVYKEYYNTSGARTSTTGSFYFQVYDADTGKLLSRSVYAINLNKSSSAYKKLSLKLASAETVRRLKIVETDKSGVQLPSGKDYQIAYENQTITLKANQTSAPKVYIRNTEVAKTPESETADTKAVANLTLTKKVTYKDAAIRVNAVYYIGIFDDAGLTKLRYKKALQFRNASEVSATLKINLYKLKSQEVTFYFAEVDANGKVVSGGTSSGYEISQNKKSVTLNKSSLNDEVVVTNNIKQGSGTEKMLTTPGSGFAGDSAALAEAQQLEASSNSSVKTATGDATPIIPLVIALAVSGGILCILAGVVRRRQRKGTDSGGKN